MPGGVPPPLPPPPSQRQGVLLRHWHWKKISALRVPRESVWQRIAEAESAGDTSVQFDTLEEHFARRQSAVRLRCAGAEATTAEQKALSILDAKRTHIFEIELAPFKMPFGTLVELLRGFDSQRSLTAEQLESLVNLIPTADELARARSLAAEGLVKGEAALGALSRPDAFLVAIAELPSVDELLRTILLMRTFDADAEELIGLCELVAAAAEQVMASGALQSFLGLCLYVGNWMNRGSLYGDAKAFAIASLIQMVSMKSTADGSTLLAHILEQLRHVAPEAIHLPAQLHLLRRATRVGLSPLEQGIAEIRAHASRLAAQLERLPPLAEPPRLSDGTPHVRHASATGALLVIRVSQPALVHWALCARSAGAGARASTPATAGNPFPHMSHPVSPICQKLILFFRCHRCHRR